MDAALLLDEDPVTLVGFTLKRPLGRKVRHQAPSSSLSRVASTKHHSPQLVRFAAIRSSSIGSNTRNNNKTSQEVKMERERKLRQERLLKLSQETRDWFDKMQQQQGVDSVDDRRLSDQFSQQKEECFSSLLGNSEGLGDFMRGGNGIASAMTLPFGGFPSHNNTRNFFSNGNKFANSFDESQRSRSEDREDDWPSPHHKNMDVIRSMSSSSGLGSSSWSHQHQQRVHLQRTFASTSTSSSGSSSNSSSTGSMFSSAATIEAPPAFADQKPSSCPCPHQGGEGGGGGGCGQSGGFVGGFPKFAASPGEMHNCFGRFSSFGGFPRFTPIILSPPEQFKTGSQFHMQSLRSTFEYCGNTNSYRYSTEQVSQCYQESYDVSESESEDEYEDRKGERRSGGSSESTKRRVGGNLVRRVCSPSDSGVGSSRTASSSPPPSPSPSPSPSPLELQLDCVSVSAPSELDSCCSGSQSGSPRSSGGLLLAIQPPPEPRKDRAYRIALELLSTERSYVGVLHLIDQVFQFQVDHENRAHHMFAQEMIPQMFSNIKSIYKLHHDFLLPQLEERMQKWDEERRIGDIMKNFAPFLKMYTEYVRSFDNAMNMINIMYAKNQRFSSIMDEIHRRPECGNLTLQHHMLSPIQRVPRYELLLKEYLKKLPEDSPDREDTETALHLVSTAANHANEAMKKIDKFKQLLEIQERIGGAVDLVSPTRELIREGKIVKISARSGDHQERYLFLFNDLLLLCSQSNRVMSGHNHYRPRARFSVDYIQILEGDNLETANTFYIRDSHKNIELYTQTPEEKDAWISSFIQAITELDKRKSSLKIGNDSLKPHENEIGKRPPNLIKMDSVVKCMDCSAQFTMMRRKHHCRACGVVVCSKCSSQKCSLQFEDKTSRVCRQCYQILQQQLPDKCVEKSPDLDEVTKENSKIVPNRDKGLLEVHAEATSVLSGYLLLKTRGKSWVRRWFSLHPDFVLYSFRDHSEPRAMTATPVPGYTIARVAELKGESGIQEKEKERVFKLFHARKSYYFQAGSKDEVDRWVQVLQMAARAELPLLAQDKDVGSHSAQN